MRAKRFFSLVICIVLLMGMNTFAFAAQSRSITVDPINVMVGGKIFLPADGNGKNVPVFVYNGTTYAPLRALAEAYGLNVGYNAASNLAAVSGSPSANFVGTKGTAQALTERTDISVSPINIEVNGAVFQPKDANGKIVEVFVYEGTTYAPLRALAEAYGLTVGYNSEKQLATVDFVASGDSAASENIDFAEIFAEISAAHKELVTSATAFNGVEKYIISNTAAADMLTDAEVHQLISQHSVNPTITYDQAAADIDLFFRAFESAYGGYYYFGKAAFDTAKAEMMTWLSGRKSVSYEEFEAALGDAMDFLQDAHVSIGGIDRGIDLEYEYFYCEGQNYNSDANGFYKTIDSEKWYFASFSDNRVSMERSLTADGEVVYSPVLFCPEPDMKNSSIILKNASGKTKSEALSWIRNESYWGGYFDGVDYNLVEEDGIAYISLRSCDNYYSDTLFQYAASSAEVRDASLIIFDIRGNGGGSELYSMDWITSFIGYGPSLPLAGGTRYSTLRTATGFDGGHIAAGTFESYSNSGRWIANDIPIVVLVDEYVASAGESTLNYLRSMDNVIVVGSNTTGAQLCGNVMDFFLPNSGTYFRFGSGIGFQFDTSNKDFRGYEPDIWCNPKDSLDAVMKMVERYDLANSVNISNAGSSIKDVVSEKTDIVLYLTMDLDTGAFHQPDPELYPGQRCGMPEIDASQVWTIYKGGEYRSDFTASSANPDIAKTTIFEWNGRTFLEVRATGYGVCEFYVTVDGETAKFIFTSAG